MSALGYDIRFLDEFFIIVIIFSFYKVNDMLKNEQHNFFHVSNNI